MVLNRQVISRSLFITTGLTHRSQISLSCILGDSGKCEVGDIYLKLNAMLHMLAMADYIQITPFYRVFPLHAHPILLQGDKIQVCC
jgi:hypothetical protein